MVQEQLSESKVRQLEKAIEVISKWQAKLKEEQFKDISRKDLSGLIELLVSFQNEFKIYTTHTFVSKEDIMKLTGNDEGYLSQLNFKDYEYMLKEGNMFKTVTKQSILDQLGEVKKNFTRRVKQARK